MQLGRERRIRLRDSKGQVMGDEFVVVVTGGLLKDPALAGTNRVFGARFHDRMDDRLQFLHVNARIAGQKVQMLPSRLFQRVLGSGFDLSGRDLMLGAQITLRLSDLIAKTLLLRG